jgi:two-component system chemotaxis sensor kinase CheA
VYVKKQTNLEGDMSLSAKIREQLISSFRAELAEHVQMMNDGLLALEQGRVRGKERQTLLEDIFRAAHSLKGAARAVGVTVVEQLAHALESVLDAIQHDAIELSSELFNACYQTLDAVQAVQTAYEAGETTPPLQALQALSVLAPFASASRDDGKHGADKAAADAAVPDVVEDQATEPETPPRSQTGAEEQMPVQERPKEPAPPSADEPVEPAGVQGKALGGETVRVDVAKLDALMAQLSELLIAKIRAEQRLAQIRECRELTAVWQKEWLSVRSTYNHLVRQEQDGLLSAHRIKSIDALRERSGASPEGPGRDGQRPKPSGSREDAPSQSGRREEYSADPTQSRDLQEVSKGVSRLLAYTSANQEWLRTMSTLINDLSRQYASDTMQMSLIIDSLEEEIKRVRMLPLSTITGPFGRMVRDLAQQAGKEAVLQIVGAETEMDRQVLEQIKDPLIHMLRNAVDHGIELPARREACGKPRAGAITLTAEQIGKNIVLSVSDDGAGLDLETIRQTLGRRGRTDAPLLSEAELLETIFQPGVSTSAIITDISGRGVGLDVVRRNVQALQGTTTVDWRPGEGTRFTLTLPLKVTSSRGLLLRVSDQMFAVPLTTVERIVSVRPHDLVPLEGRDTIRHNGRPVTLVWLSDVLELPRQEDPYDEAKIPVVILTAGGRRMAFAVDELVGEQEIVIKDLGAQLAHVGGIAGATLMGTGDVVLILNVADLIKLAMRAEHPSVRRARTEAHPAAVEKKQRHILIVDDSITTRTLEKNILEAAGYAIRLATDGQEALSTIAADGIPDLIVADVVMPRMDGFELTRRIRGETATTEVPVILVTSLDSPEDKARGIGAGADAYIVKSSFDQNNLLETIEQLI